MVKLDYVLPWIDIGFDKEESTKCEDWSSRRKYAAVHSKRLVLAKLRNFNKLIGQMVKSAGNKAKNNYTSRSFHIENLVFI